MIQRSHEGFTLSEVMIALFILAIVATIGAIGLHTLLQTEQHLKRIDARWEEIQTALTLMQGDFD